MNTKERYNKPDIEIVAIEIDDNVMVNTSPGGRATEDLNNPGSHSGGSAGSKQRNFWD